MKTIILLFGLTVLLSFSSCTKDWTCKCVTDNGDRQFYTIPESSLKDAKRTCDEKEYNLLGSRYRNCSVDAFWQ